MEQASQGADAKAQVKYLLSGVGEGGGAENGREFDEGARESNRGKKVQGTVPPRNTGARARKDLLYFFLGMFMSWHLILKVIKSHERHVSRGMA